MTVDEELYQLGQEVTELVRPKGGAEPQLLRTVRMPSHIWHAIFQEAEKEDETPDETIARKIRLAHEYEQRQTNPIQRVSHDSAGNVDDICIDCDSVHIERMDDNYWWIGVYRGGKEIMLHIKAKRARVDAYVTSDDLNCTEE